MLWSKVSCLPCTVRSLSLFATSLVGYFTTETSYHRYSTSSVYIHSHLPPSSGSILSGEYYSFRLIRLDTESFLPHTRRWPECSYHQHSQSNARHSCSIDWIQYSPLNSIVTARVPYPLEIPLTTSTLNKIFLMMWLLETRGNDHLQASRRLHHHSVHLNCQMVYNRYCRFHARQKVVFRYTFWGINNDWSKSVCVLTHSWVPLRTLCYL